MTAVARLRPLPTPPSSDQRLLVTLSVQELQEFIRVAVSEVIAEARPPERVLLSGSELGMRLGCSRATVHRLRREGMPSVKLGDTFKFELDTVVSWLRRGSK